jgi:hypothetical protein
MNLPKYPVVASDPYRYHFYSEGPQGRIKRAFIYAQIEDNLFNLAFGDWDEDLRRIHDSTRSNNQDRDKVLATMAFTALDFTNQFSLCRDICRRQHSSQKQTIPDCDR